LNGRGLTLVVVTHNLDLARRAGKIYTLRDGRIAGYEEISCPNSPTNAGAALP
jgi:ABC-type lipoprotein export system ATPase subunit